MIFNIISLRYSRKMLTLPDSPDCYREIDLGVDFNSLCAYYKNLCSVEGGKSISIDKDEEIQVMVDAVQRIRSAWENSPSVDERLKASNGVIVNASQFVIQCYGWHQNAKMYPDRKLWGMLEGVNIAGHTLSNGILNQVWFGVSMGYQANILLPADVTKFYELI